jgi:hypothetical protein
MIDYTTFNPDTGKILRVGRTDSQRWAIEQAEHFTAEGEPCVLLNVRGDKANQRVVDGKLVDSPVVDETPLEVINEQLKNAADVDARTELKSLASTDDLLRLIIEVLVNPDSTALEALRVWRASSIRIETNRLVAHAEIDRRGTPQ